MGISVTFSIASFLEWRRLGEMGPNVEVPGGCGGSTLRSLEIAPAGDRCRPGQVLALPLFWCATVGKSLFLS